MSTQKSDGHTVVWGYEGEIAPTHWGELCPEFSLCALGKHQSPIDIAGATPAPGSPVALDYQATTLSVINNSHSIQVDCDGESKLTLEGKDYTLLQFHFHAPSEHSLDGRLLAMEAHFVHQSADGELLVVGVFAEPGAEHSELAKVWAHLPTEPGPAQMYEGESIHPRLLLPDAPSYYRYVGSLTTPPCSEGVIWLVCTEPVTYSSEQIAAFEAVMGGNNRPTLPLNGRELFVDS